MEVILQDNYPQLGFVGDKVTVKNGFARNFLIPQGLAVEINRRNEKFLKNKLQQIEAKKIRLKSEADAIGSKIASETFEFQLKVGKKGKAFGSITVKNIFDAVVEKGYNIESNQVTLPSPVKFVGDFTFNVKLHTEVNQEVAFKVVADEVAPTKEEEAAEANVKEEAPVEPVAEEDSSVEADKE